jgi:LysM repeat protein
MIVKFNKSTSQQINRSALAIVMLLASQGCMRDQVIVPDPSGGVTQRQADALIRQARVEAEALRAEMAATRIAAAKQEAEVQELRREVEELRQAEARLRAANADLTRTNTEREEAQQQALATKEAELMALRAEKDRLVQSASELQVKLAMGLQARQKAVGGVAAQAKLKELESTVALLAVELAELKKRLAEKGAEPLQSANALILDAGQVVSIRVKPGDSLWGLARKYGVSLADLKAANRLQGDQINVGQRLTIPVRGEE